MEISIVGAGAMGLLWAWRLQGTGHQVHLIGRKGSAEQALHKNVIVHYRKAAEHVSFELSSDPGKTADSSYIFLWVKAYATAEAAASLEPYLQKNQTLITLQNGLGNAKIIASACPGSAIIAGTTTAGAYIDNEKLVVSSLGETRLGSYLHDPEPAELVALLNSAGLSTSVCTDVGTAIWEKAAINAAINPLCALLGERNGALTVNSAAQASVAALQTSILKEVVQAASYKGINLDAEALFARAQTVCRDTATNYSSMLMDIRNGKKTEIDALNGAIASIAEQGGIEAPVNRTITALIHVLEIASSTALNNHADT